MDEIPGGKSVGSPEDPQSAPWHAIAGEKVELFNRDPRLPVFFIVKNHPLRSHLGPEHCVGKTYVYIADRRIESMHAAFSYFATLRVPQGDAESVRKLGIMDITNGDAIFARDMHGSGIPVDDVIQAWVVGEECVPAHLIAMLAKAADAMLGPRDERGIPGVPGNHKPVVVNDMYEGGVVWERSQRAKSLANAPRAYPMCTSVETQRALHAPAAAAKNSADPDIQAHNDTRREMVKAMSHFAMNAFRYGPVRLQQLVEDHSEAVNVPHIGHWGNYAFPSMQCNIAGAQQEGNEQSMEDDLGPFGAHVPHLDGHDSWMQPTAMTMFTDIPSTYDPGRMHLSELGVCMRMTQFSTLIFWGLRLHGGSPVRAPIGESVVAWAIRLGLISYPRSDIADGGSGAALAALPNGEVLKVGKEISSIAVQNRDTIGSCTHANYARDGHNIMDPESVLNFLVRACLYMFLFFFLQVPADFNAKINIPKFVDCFSFTVDGNVIRPTLLKRPPPSPAASPAQQSSDMHEEGQRTSSASPAEAGPSTLTANAAASPPTIRILSLSQQRQLERDTYGTEERAELMRRVRSWHHDIGSTIPVVALEPRSRVVSGFIVPGTVESCRAPKYTKTLPDLPSLLAQLSIAPELAPVAAKKTRGSQDKGPRPPKPNGKGKGKASDKRPASPDQEASSQKRRRLDDGLDACLVGPGYMDAIGIGENTSDAQPGGLRRSERARGGTENTLGASTTGISASNTDRSDNNAPQKSTQGSRRVTRANARSNADTVPPETSTQGNGRETRAMTRSPEDAGSPPRHESEEAMDVDEVGPEEGGKTINSVEFAELPPIFRTITQESVAEQLRQMVESQKAISSAPSGEALRTNLDAAGNFDDLLSAMAKAPLSESTGTSMPSAWKTQDLLVGYHAQTELSIRAQRQRIMILHFRAWEWLHANIAKECDAHFYKLQTSKNWLARLVRHVDKLVTSTQNAASIDPTTYLPIPEAQPYNYRCSRIPTLDPDERYDRVSGIVMSILQAWLSFPTNASSLPQYYFLDIIIRQLSPAGLLLDQVWRTYSYVRTTLTSFGWRKKLMKRSDFETFDDALGDHPIASRLSTEHALLIDMQRIVNDFLLTLSLPPVEELRTPLPRTKLRAKKKQPAIVQQPSIPRVGKPELMLAFIRASASALDLNLADGETSTENAWLTALTSDTDRFLPFREFGRSRLRMKKDGGPFSPPANVRTSAGLFSNIIMRGITFHTDFLYDGDHPTLFTDIHHWQDTISAARETVKSASRAYISEREIEKYFCIKNAYGTATKRSTGFATRYAATAVDSAHNAWLLKGEKPSYVSLWTAVKSIADGNPYPQLGPLIGHLFVADYVYADAVSMPSVDDMADIIWQINAGGVAGLVALGLLPPKKKKAKHDKQEVRDALDALYRFMEEHLEVEEAKKMIFDIIMLEHALCKYVRYIAWPKKG